ncbi:MAG: GHKL domain-containing protein [Lachnospiraceae bacterium]|nr:GHKL domain-containing protein [Lachnospiraceae bacterium]
MGPANSVSILFMAAAAVLAVSLVVILWQYHRLRSAFERLQETLKDLESLNFRLRAERHDHLNQMQVAYGLLELNEYEELRKYMEPLVKLQLKTGKAMRTAKPAINALLMAKLQEAESCGVDLYIEVHSSLDKLAIPDWDLCRILSNLIDNAITAAGAGMSDGDKLEGDENAGAEGKARRQGRVDIEISEDKENYCFCIRNNGRRIPEQDREKIFRSGFTTKKDPEHGMGLSIVKELLQKYSGQIHVDSDDEKTEFSFALKKQTA